MTIKVISRISKIFEPFRLKCQACGAELEVSEFTDLKIGIYGGGRGEMIDSQVYVNCPDCDSDVRLAEREQKLYLLKILALRKKN